MSVFKRVHNIKSVCCIGRGWISYTQNWISEERSVGDIATGLGCPFTTYYKQIFLLLECSCPCYNGASNGHENKTHIKLSSSGFSNKNPREKGSSYFTLFCLFQTAVICLTPTSFDLFCRNKIMFYCICEYRLLCCIVKYEYQTAEPSCE